MSLILLDERLKAYYPQKGKIQTEIYQVRSGEITLHKRRYQLHAKEQLDRLDLQTQGFNYQYEDIWKACDDHVEKVKQLEKILPDQNALTSLQGVLNAAREADSKFGELLRDTMEKMDMYSEDEIDFLRKQNENFIKSSVQMDNGGTYSQGEIDWYQTMLQEIEEKIAQHQEKRREMAAESQKRSSEKREKILTTFKENQLEAIDEFSAKEASGKVFGRPRRAAQEIVRSELTMCMNVADAQNKLLDELRKCLENYHEYKENAIKGDVAVREKAEKFMDKLSQDIRFLYMSLRSSVYFYGTYLEAYKDGNVVDEFRRVSYDETKVDLELPEEEKKIDETRKVKELEIMGKMYYRGKDVKYLKKIEEMEKVVVSESAKLYTGKYQKFIEGNGLTKVLKEFVAGLRIEMEEFRQSAVRELRTLTNGLSDLSEEVNIALFGCVFYRSNIRLERKDKEIKSWWSVDYKESETKKNDHMRELRPNLAHPENKQELDTLVTTEKTRSTKILEKVEVFKESKVDNYFSECNNFFLALLNNLNFMMSYYDKWILNEDYIILPGDENVEKKHLNLKKLIIKKEKGDLVDTASERSIKKVWRAFSQHSFAYQDKIPDIKVVRFF